LNLRWCFTLLSRLVWKLLCKWSICLSFLTSCEYRCKRNNDRGDSILDEKEALYKQTCKKAWETTGFSLTKVTECSCTVWVVGSTAGWIEQTFKAETSWPDLLGTLNLIRKRTDRWLSSVRSWLSTNQSKNLKGE
jgi:hypothetical protein